MILIRKIKSFLMKTSKWKGSANYWEKRYKLGGNSGSGSYNHLAVFKAEVLNNFVKDNNIETVIEWGCGDGNQLGYANYPQYVGFDVSKSAIKMCQKRYESDKTKRFVWSGQSDFSTDETAQLTLSLDVIYHLVENDIFEKYMRDLFRSSEKYVIIYAPNYNENTAQHCAPREFTSWIEKNYGQEWKLESVIKNKYPYDVNRPQETSWSDFYIFIKK